MYAELSPPPDSQRLPCSAGPTNFALPPVHNVRVFVYAKYTCVMRSAGSVTGHTLTHEPDRASHPKAPTAKPCRRIHRARQMPRPMHRSFSCFPRRFRTGGEQDDSGGYTYRECRHNRHRILQLAVGMNEIRQFPGRVGAYSSGSMISSPWVRSKNVPGWKGENSACLTPSAPLIPTPQRTIERDQPVAERVFPAERLTHFGTLSS